MKVRILAIGLFLLGTVIACKKIELNIPKSIISDERLRIDKNSMFADEERKIKTGVMNFTKLSIKDRKKIVDGIVMENKNVIRIMGNMSIFVKLDKVELVNLYKILIPNSNFTIMNGNKMIVQYYNPSWADRPCWKSYWYKYYTSWYTDSCESPGENQCFQYLDC